MSDLRLLLERFATMSPDADVVMLRDLTTATPIVDGSTDPVDIAVGVAVDLWLTDLATWLPLGAHPTANFVLRAGDLVGGQRTLVAPGGADTPSQGAPLPACWTSSVMNDRVWEIVDPVGSRIAEIKSRPDVGWLIRLIVVVDVGVQPADG